jgi:flagellar L-ring protein precursor FlgH
MMPPSLLRSVLRAVVSTLTAGVVLATASLASAATTALALVAAMMLAGCASPRHEVDVARPTTIRPAARPVGGTPTGGIWQPAGFRPLFEDRKPRYVGDLVTVQLNEKLDATQKANNSAERNDTAKIATPGISGVLGALKLPALAGTASSANKFDGKGENASSNSFTGTITVTVIEVLPNGNLVVAGEKQLGLRQNSEVLRVSGVVDPAQIQPGNTIVSTQLADVRIDYRGGGNVEQAMIQGWLSRFFNSWAPF